MAIRQALSTVIPMRRLALRWLWWAFVWDVGRYCALNPWRFFVALPLWIVGTVTVITSHRHTWGAPLAWNIQACWEAIEAGDVKRPPAWLARRLEPTPYLKLGDLS